MKEDLQTQIVNESMQELADQLDKDIVWDMLYKDDYPYTVAISLIELHQRMEWLTEHFGNRYRTWAEYRGQLYFKNQEDFVLYTLRW
jgi:hypothetical protein